MTPPGATASFRGDKRTDELDEVLDEEALLLGRVD